MKNKLIKILSAILIGGSLFSIPVNAEIKEINSNYYNKEIQDISDYYNTASKDCNTTRLEISKEKSTNLLNRIKNDINENTIDEFKNQCITIENVMNEYKELKYNEVYKFYQISGGGSGCGRDQVRKEVEIDLDTCKLLTSKINEYNNSIDWHIKIYDPEHKHFKLEDEKWYYYKDNGKIATNEYINGYYFGADGVWVR